MCHLHVGRNEFVNGTYHFNPSKNPPERNKLYWQAHWKPLKSHESTKMAEKPSSISNPQGISSLASSKTKSYFPFGFFGFFQQRKATVN